MSVFTGDQFLGEAIESILCQTFEDFEFIIVDDGSKDESNSIIRDYARRDRRIRLIENDANLGLSTSLNKGMSAARGEYIARMDADDISAVQRFERQVKFLDTNQNIGICGTWVEYFGTKDELIKFPLSHDAIYANLLFQNVIIHPSVMMRSGVINNHDLFYDNDIRYAQDYELWSRAISKVKLANLDQVLLRYRVHSQGIGSRFSKEQSLALEAVFRRLLSNLGLEPSSKDIQLHRQIAINQFGEDWKYLYRSQTWLELISRCNINSNSISQEILDSVLGDIWARVCYSHLHPEQVLFHILTRKSQYRSHVSTQKILMENWPRLEKVYSKFIQ